MPGGHLPLHIFEERYKEMIGEALRDKTEFGIVLVTGKGLSEAGCTATIEGVLQQYPDGRLDIVTLGRRRFEILLVNEERSFLRGAIEFFDDDTDPNDAPLDARQVSIEAYNSLQSLWGNQPLEEAGLTDPRVSFRLVRAIKDLEFRQSILTCRSEAQRIRRLADYLPDFARHVRREKTIKGVAPLNGFHK